ncbi:hypothetical protein [Spongiivirga citrea]|uniref:Uncharacterized protein n=1 Tax=Spongiivirga citrea TaxID=1481457 RepID=A0A6M0CPI2_9FLAO|nr:hypothetical protein [Spongiivirga citrea]NER17779.1 hypothetical protein [Spongiivirga citrea]
MDRTKTGTRSIQIFREYKNLKMLHDDELGDTTYLAAFTSYLVRVLVSIELTLKLKLRTS